MRVTASGMKWERTPGGCMQHDREQGSIAQDTDPNTQVLLEVFGLTLSKPVIGQLFLNHVISQVENGEPVYELCQLTQNIVYNCPI